MESNIKKTRKGYRYQDMFALYTFLKLLQDEEKNNFKYFIDFPFLNNNKEGSLDILYILQSPSVTYYSFEVKTGRSFQNNFERIKKLLLNFYYYQKEEQQKVNHSFIMSEEINRITNIKSCWYKIQNKQRYFPEQSIWGNLKRISSNDLIDSFLNKVKLGNQFRKGNNKYKKFRRFAKMIKWEVKNDLKSLEIEIIGCLDNIIKTLKARSSEVVLPKDYLLKLLLAEIRISAGIGKKGDIFPKLKKIIINFCTGRKIVCKRNHTDTTFDEEKRKVTKLFEEKFEKTEEFLKEKEEIIIRQEGKEIKKTS
jgi:hypothetical protein